MEAAEFFDEPFEIEIKKGVALHTWPNGRKRAVPIDVFRVQVERANRALAEFDAGKRVLPLKKKRDHAASP